jgi:hypothetical protein
MASLFSSLGMRMRILRAIDNLLLIVRPPDRVYNVHRVGRMLTGTKTTQAMDQVNRYIDCLLCSGHAGADPA